MPATLHPSHHYAELTEERLQVVADLLLDVRYNALAVTQTAYDDNYTRECLVFGRTRQMIIKKWQAKEFPWLDVKNAGMDVTFTIGGVPLRFFRDDPKNPTKHGFFRRNDVDQLFAPEDNKPVLWRFIVERAMTEEDEDQVYLVGYNAFEEKICEWRHQPSTGVLHSVDSTTPPAVDLPDAEVTVRSDEQLGDDEAQGTETGSK